MSRLGTNFQQDYRRQSQETRNWTGPVIAGIALGIIGVLVAILIGIGFIHPFGTSNSQSLYQRYHDKRPTIANMLVQDNGGWSVLLGARVGGSCTFEDGAFDALQPTSGAVTTCVMQNIHVTNFALQVDLQIKSGFGGGVALRVGLGGYRFDVTREGTADFVSTANGPYDDTSTLWTGSINNGAAIGTDQDITIFVTALSNRFDFWVNGVQLGGVTVENPPPQTGDAIGVFAFCQGNDPARASFSNLEVWNT
jgi:hypothetical protein